MLHLNMSQQVTLDLKSSLRAVWPILHDVQMLDADIRYDDGTRGRKHAYLIQESIPSAH